MYVCVCLCVYLSIHMHGSSALKNVCVYMHAHVHTFIFCTYTHARIHTPTGPNPCLYICTHTCIHLYFVRIHTHVYTHLRDQIHACTQSQEQSAPAWDTWCKVTCIHRKSRVYMHTYSHIWGYSSLLHFLMNNQYVCMYLCMHVHMHRTFLHHNNKVCHLWWITNMYVCTYVCMYICIELYYTTTIKCAM
jgi:hypothetical protein